MGEPAGNAPEFVRVKLSSEAAESISLTPVVVREMPLHELVEHMLGVTGKDERRVRELLLRGTLVSGASRFRWAGWEADPAHVRELLAGFPDPDPGRLFAPQHCVRASLRGGRVAIEIPRQAGERKSLFRRATFWALLLEIAGGAGPRYQTYSYKERADVFHLTLEPAAVERLRAGAGLLTYSSLRDHIRQEAFHWVEFLVEREPLTP